MDTYQQTSDLTSREREILVLAANGLTNAAIARRLYLAEETVKTHLTRTSRKLGTVSRTHAVATAMRRQLIA